MGAKAQTPKDSNVKALYCKRFFLGGGYGAREIKLPQEYFLVGPFETGGHR